MKRLGFILCAFMNCLSANGAVLVSGASKIVSIQSYADYGGGDVIFSIDPVDDPCVGYFMKKGDPGFEANLSMLLASYHSKSTIQIRAHDNVDWRGSSEKYCHVYSLKYL